MKPTLLCIHYPEKMLPKLRVLAMRHGVKVQEVEPWAFLHTVGDLAEGNLKEDTRYEGEPFAEPMLVFAEFPEKLVSQMLNNMRASRLPAIPLKAVMTATNREWNVLTLHENLLEEHLAMQKGTTAHE